MRNVMAQMPATMASAVITPAWSWSLLELCELSEPTSYVLSTHGTREATTGVLVVNGPDTGVLR